MEGCNVRWACLAWVVCTTTHRLVILQVQASDAVPVGWYCLPEIGQPALTVKSASRVRANHGKQISPVGAMPSVASATVRRHLPGLYTAEPPKKYHSTTTFLPLATLGDLLATMNTTRREWADATVTAVGVQTQPFTFHHLLACKATRSVFRVDLPVPGSVSDMRLCGERVLGDVQGACVSLWAHPRVQLPSRLPRFFVLLKIVLAIFTCCVRPLACSPPVATPVFPTQLPVILDSILMGSAAAIDPVPAPVATSEGDAAAALLDLAWEGYGPLPPPPGQACLSCGRAAALVCSRCHAARYCNAVCQKQHWVTVHSLDCKAGPADAPTPAGSGTGRE